VKRTRRISGWPLVAGMLLGMIAVPLVTSSSARAQPLISKEEAAQDPRVECYEPLGTDQFTDSRGRGGSVSFSAGAGNEAINLADSDTKPCNVGGLAVVVESGRSLELVTAVDNGNGGLDVPAGATQTHAVKFSGGTTDQHVRHNGSLRAGRTRCYRAYFRAGSGATQSNPNNRLKISTMEGQGFEQFFEMEIAKGKPDSSATFRIETSAGSSCGGVDTKVDTVGSDEITLAEAKEAWIMHWACVDYGSDGTYDVRAAVRNIETGRTARWSTVNGDWRPGSPPSGCQAEVPLAQEWIANRFTQNQASDGYVYAASAGGWDLPFNQDFEPPGSCEMEGGCGTPPAARDSSGPLAPPGRPALILP